MAELFAWTERDLLDRLRIRYSTVRRNGSVDSPVWAYAEHVRNDAGFAATRTIDALAMALYPGEGLALHAFEVKTSRGDWLRELADPRKAAAFERHVEFFWLVCPSGVAHYEELPARWGLLVPLGASSLRAVRPALPLRPVVPYSSNLAERRPDPVDRGLVVDRKSVV